MTKVYTLFKSDDSVAPVRLTLPPGATDPGPLDGWERVEGDFADGAWRWDPVEGKPVPLTPPAPPEPPAITEPLVDILWRGVRARRNQLLAETDYVAIRAAENAGQPPLAWRQYRQALRDVTNQPDPLNITWPVPPLS